MTSWSSSGGASAPEAAATAILGSAFGRVDWEMANCRKPWQIIWKLWEKKRIIILKWVKKKFWDKFLSICNNTDFKWTNSVQTKREASAILMSKRNFDNTGWYYGLKHNLLISSTFTSRGDHSFRVIHQEIYSNLQNSCTQAPGLF